MSGVSLHANWAKRYAVLVHAHNEKLARLAFNSQISFIHVAFSRSANK